MNLKKSILFLSCFLTVVIWFNPCYFFGSNILLANSYSNSQASEVWKCAPAEGRGTFPCTSVAREPLYSDDQVYESSFLKTENVEELAALELENWHRLPPEMPTEEQLLKLSERLRDIARYLGSTWPVVIPIERLAVASNDEVDGKSPWKIAEFRSSRDTWRTIAVGQVLGWIAQELQILESSQEQPLVDFRLSDEGSDRYRLLMDVPLSRYCYEILRLFHR